MATSLCVSLVMTLRAAETGSGIVTVEIVRLDQAFNLVLQNDVIL